MIARIRKAMAGRDKGFTLVELLVVIVIIGILTAIAIPTFLGQRNKAYDAAAKSDLKNLATAAETYFVDANTYPATKDDWDDTALDVKVSKGGKYLVTEADADSYVIYGESKSGTWFKLDSASGGAPEDTGTTAPTGTPLVTIDFTSGTAPTFS